MGSINAKSSSSDLHMFFFPFMAHGHMIPALDMAKMFATAGVKATIITTPSNAAFFSEKIQRSKNSDVPVDMKLLKFPCAEVGLPEGCENVDFLTGSGAACSQQVLMDLSNRFMKALALLQQPLEQLLEECRPDCLVSDLFFPWTTDAAAKFGIPRLVFHVTCFFSLSASMCLWLHQPHDKVESDSETFEVPNLPGNIMFTRNQLPDYMLHMETEFAKMVKASRESELKSYGVVINSFYELEGAYVDFYRNVLGIKAWHVGPISLCNQAIEDKAERGKKTSIDEHLCLKWLDSKKKDSVVYICFGSVANFNSAQLKEIAMGLETSGQHFIWVVRKDQSVNEQDDHDWFGEGFEKRMEGKGLIIRGWSPQMLILEHSAVGGFVTHCGWNSTLEGITTGVPMVTWPVSEEQFYNEKLIAHVLKIGVSIGVKKWVRGVGDFVERKAIENSVKALMVGNKGEEMRRKAKALSEVARMSVEKGGSSYLSLNDLIQELRSY